MATRTGVYRGLAALKLFVIHGLFDSLQCYGISVKSSEFLAIDTNIHVVINLMVKLTSIIKHIYIYELTQHK